MKSHIDSYLDQAQSHLTRDQVDILAQLADLLSPEIYISSAELADFFRDSHDPVFPVSNNETDRA